MSLVNEKEKFIYAVGWLDCWAMMAPLAAENHAKATQGVPVKVQFMLNKIKEHYLPDATMEQAVRLVDLLHFNNDIHNTIMDIMRSKMRQDEMIAAVKKAGWKIKDLP